MRIAFLMAVIASNLGTAIPTQAQTPQTDWRLHDVSKPTQPNNPAWRMQNVGPPAAADRVAPTNCPATVQDEDTQARAGDPVAALCALSTAEHSQQGLICERPNMDNVLACIEHNKLRIFYASVIAKNSPDEALRKRFRAYVIEFKKVVAGWERDYRYNKRVEARGSSRGAGRNPYGGYSTNSNCAGGHRAYGEFGPTWCP